MKVSGKSFKYTFAFLVNLNYYLLNKIDYLILLKCNVLSTLFPIPVYSHYIFESFNST